MEDDEIDFKEYYLVIKNNILLILAIFFVVMAGTLLYLYLTPRIYEGKAVVMLGDNENYLAEAEVIKSNILLTQVYLEIGQDFKITTFPIKASNIIEIKAKSENPNIARNAANRVADAYLFYINKTKLSDVEQIRTGLVQQRDVYQQQLIVLNDLSDNYKSKNNRTDQEEIKYQNTTLSIANTKKQIASLSTRIDGNLNTALERIADIKIIEYAILPSSPVQPNVKYILLFGFVIAISLSFGVAYIKEDIMKKSSHNRR